MKYVCVDIESVGIDTAAEYLPVPEPIEPPDLSTIVAGKNLVDPAKIAADIEKRKQAALENYQERIAAQAEKFADAVGRAGLEPDLARIVCIGWRFSDHPHVNVISCRSEEAESNVLCYFWGQVRDAKLITFNGFRFDLPMLMRRSLYLGVKHPNLSLDKYRSPHIDLWQRLSYNGAITGHSMAFYVKRLGLETTDTLTGKDIARIVQAANEATDENVRNALWHSIENHCTSDVNLTYQIAERLGVIEAVRVERELEAEGVA